MAAYVILIPPNADPGDDGAVVVKDGFAWLAFVIPVLWFAFHRMWLWAAGFLVLGFVLSLAADRTDWQVTALVLGLLVNLWTGLEAGAMQIAHLRRNGWSEADIVVAPDRQAAEDIHFANAVASGGITRPPAGTSARGNSLPPRGDEGPALGLFDHDGGR